MANNLLIIISDSNGIILETIGDRNIHNKAESLHLISGANWAEHACGTNAIGTALKTKHPLQVHSNEHYCTTAKKWTCTANVIRHPITKEILGVLDVSGLKDSYNQQTLALVTSLASQIENQLYTQEIEDQKILLEKYMYLQQVKPYASILLNQHGYAVHMNNKMYELILKNILIDEKNIYDLLKKININNINIFFQNMV